MDIEGPWSFWISLISLAIPAIFGIAAACVNARTPFYRAAGVASAAWLLSALVSLAIAVAPLVAPGQLRGWGVQLNVLTAVMLPLVCTLGWVIVRYSRTYLQAEPEQARYVRWLLVTLGAVTMLVMSNDLLIIALAWTTTSVALHQLLTFYSERPAALLAAHKKFLVSRLADLCMVGALVLVQLNVGSLQLEEVEAWVRQHQSLPLPMHVAALLFAAAVCLKSAQLPFHGWLIQVMEAPTPVSALLHAGVVNIGGFLMIRLAPLMAAAPAAQLLLVAVGLTTAVLAALVMTTRVSIKVSLAWSTAAQMGFMLVECGLGAWQLALVHLVAHSCYKAHAFLSSGNTVAEWRALSLLAKAQPLTIQRLAVSVLGAGVILGAGVLGISRFLPGHTVSSAVLALLMTLSLVPLLAQSSAASLLGWKSVLTRGLGVTLLYVGWHASAIWLLPVPEVEHTEWGWSLLALGTTGLFLVQVSLQLSPHGRFATWLHPQLFAGFFLDERFTRWTFALWPPRISSAPRSINFPALAESLET